MPFILGYGRAPTSALTPMEALRVQSEGPDSPNELLNRLGAKQVAAYILSAVLGIDELLMER